jgi:hypothetical protein
MSTTANDRPFEADVTEAGFQTLVHGVAPITPAGRLVGGQWKFPSEVISHKICQESSSIPMSSSQH